ncbi:MAG: glutathione S-transferase family protein [Lautropia sp.]
MSLVLYHATGTCALASCIALEEAGADVDIRRLDFQSDAQKQPEYLAINPRGRVPALVTPHGVLTETPAILAWIAQTYPAARLAPTDPWGFAKAQEFNSYLCATVHIAHAHRRRGHRWADDPAAIEAMKSKVRANMHDCCRMIETAFFKGPWVLGDAWSVCDGYLYTIYGWLEGDGVALADFPALDAHRARMRERPAVIRVAERLKD